MNGVIMQRVIGLAIATFAFSSLSGTPAVAHSPAFSEHEGLEQGRQRGVAIDVAALLTAAKGAPPMICSLAADAVGNGGWGGWGDAPSTPLASVRPLREDRDIDSENLPPADVQQLLAGLSSDDACVRELSVRIIGTQRAETVGG